MNKKICFNLLGAWHGRPRLRLFTTKPALSPFGYAQGKLCRRVTNPVLSPFGYAQGKLCRRDTKEN